MAIKLTRRVIEKRTVEIGDNNEAGRILQDWTGLSFGQFCRKYDCTDEREAKVVYYVALAYRTAHMRANVDRDVAEQLNVSLDEPVGPPLPTWTSRDGRTQHVRDIATRHLENILHKYAGSGASIFKVIRSELDRRDVDA